MRREDLLAPIRLARAYDGAASHLGHHYALNGPRVDLSGIFWMCNCGYRAINEARVAAHVDAAREIAFPRWAGAIIAVLGES